MVARELGLLGELLVTKANYIGHSPVLGGYLLVLKDASDLFSVVKLLKESSLFQYTQLLDVWGVDYPAESVARFQVNYGFLSIRYNKRLFIRCRLPTEKGIVSLTSLFPSASWLEREVWDMYGVFFKAHPDLRRILTDYGFEGYPLRKDFPLTGFTEVRYDDEQKRVVLEPLKITQEYRYFDYLSPWESR